MALRDTEKWEALMAFLTRYTGLDELESAMIGGTAMAALLALDVSSAPPTAAQLNAAKLEYDALRNAAAYEGVVCPAMTDTNLWLEIAAQVAGGAGAPTTSTNERYAAYYSLKKVVADLTTLNTAVQADTDIAALADIDHTADIAPTAVVLADAQTAWNVFRTNSIYSYSGITLPAVNVNTALWVEIAAEAAA